MGHEMNHQPESEFAEFLGLWTEEEAKSFLAAIEDLSELRIWEGEEPV